MLGGPYREYSEPALESCMKMQRIAGVNGKISRVYEEISMLSRVVPPSVRSLQGIEASAFFSSKIPENSGSEQTAPPAVISK